MGAHTLMAVLWAWRETKRAREMRVPELSTRLKVAFRVNAPVATLLVLDGAAIGYAV